MSDQAKGISDLIDNLFDMSDLVLSTDDLDDRDRWGGGIGMEIRGLRVNDLVLLFSYIEATEENHTMCELEEITDLSNLFERAKYNHSCYYEDLPIVFEIDTPKELKNRSAKVSKLLDQYYEPINDFIPTPPSDILPVISKQGTYESGKEWAWFDQTLYLTQSIKERTGLTKFKDNFDESIKDIFRMLKINVEEMPLRVYNPDVSLFQNIKANIRSVKTSGYFPK